MNKEETPRRLLSSWKEVAAYLGCDKRTCYRWEKSLGMPIRRVEGASRSRIFAYVDEIDRWREERLAGNISPADRPSKRALPKALPFLVVAAAMALIAAALFLPRLFASPKPADFRIQGSVLLILDDKGRELWTYDTGLENLEDEVTYRAYFQIRRIDPATWSGRMPHLVIKDIDGDGRAEVLFSTQTQDEFNEGELICFSSRGKVLWRVLAGREMPYGRETFPADYRIQGFVVADLFGSGRSEIVVDSIHRPFFPSQLLVLDHAGRRLGEYWNSGHFNDIVVHDLDDDGTQEIIAGGTNNEYRTGFLAIFDPRRVRGGSPQSQEEYQCWELETGSQEAYVLLPRTDIDIVMVRQEAVAAVEILNNRRLSALMVHSGVFFELGFDLGAPEVRTSHKFEQLHARIKAEGKVQSVLNAAYYEALRKGIRVWNGTGWSTP